MNYTDLYHSATKISIQFYSPETTALMQGKSQGYMIFQYDLFL